MPKSHKKNDALNTKLQVISESSKGANRPSLKVTKVATIVSAKTSAAERTSSPSENIARDSKQSRMIALLKRQEGSTIEELVSATGWQVHSVRGAMSGALKKRLGFMITSDVKERGRVYHITGGVSASR